MQLMIISWFITLIAKTRNDGSGIVAIANALLVPLFIVKTVILSYTDSVCGMAIRRCKADTDCNANMQGMQSVCRGQTINCIQCGRQIVRLACNPRGLSVLLCQAYSGAEKRAKEKFMNQCTNYNKVKEAVMP